MKNTLKRALGASFLLCSVVNADLHTDSQKSKQVASALASLGQISDLDVGMLDISMTTGSYLVGLVGILSCLVHRQESPDPYKKAVPNKLGFSSNEEIRTAAASNANEDLFPKMNTKFWSQELKKKLLPVLSEEEIGKKVGEDWELSSAQLLHLFALSRFDEDGPIPSKFPKKTVNLSQAEWLELRDHIGELALSYRRTIEAANDNKGKGKNPAKTVHQ